MPRPPQRWTEHELQADAKVSTDVFVARRKAERAQREQAITEHAPDYRQDFLDLLAATSDLRAITGASLQDRRLLRAARFVAIPFISDDDLDSLTGANLKGWMQQTTDRGKRPSDDDFDAAAEVIAQHVDPYRASWIAKESCADESGGREVPHRIDHGPTEQPPRLAAAQRSGSPAGAGRSQRTCGSRLRRVQGQEQDAGRPSDGDARGDVLAEGATARRRER